MTARPRKMVQIPIRFDPDVAERLRRYVEFLDRAGKTAALARVVNELVDHGLKVRGY